MAVAMSFADPEDEVKLESTLRAALGDIRYEIAAARGRAIPLDSVFASALSDDKSLDPFD
jgi:hypothetical protein